VSLLIVAPLRMLPGKMLPVEFERILRSIYATNGSLTLIKRSPKIVAGDTSRLLLNVVMFVIVLKDITTDRRLPSGRV
jgi:hypothetical protein